jgi:WD40-like Beta Propeller Repeat
VDLQPGALPLSHLLADQRRFRERSTSRRAGSAAALLVAALAAGCGGHGRAGGTIVFQGSGSGRAALYAMRPDGSGLTRLPVRLPADGAVVSWTRDGTKALVTYDTGNGGAAGYVYEPAAGTRRVLRLPGLLGGSAVLAEDLTLMPWSPDGTRLLLGTDTGDVVLDVETGVYQFVRDERATDLLTWSADGKSALFPAGRDIYAAPADGRPATRLMRLPFEPGALEQSADAKWLSFERYGARDTVYVVRTDGTGLHPIARDAESSAWSPTGERLAFADHHGVDLVDLENGHRLLLSDELLGDPANEGPAWSPDGRRILYWRDDLGDGAALAQHLQLWTVKADGTDAQPVTHAFPVDYGADEPAWVEATVEGTPPPSLPLVSLSATRTTTTRLPIVALAAEGDRAAVAQGFGGVPGSHGSLGPLLVWDRLRGTTATVAVHGCGAVDDVLLVAGRVGYRCDNASEGYSVRDELRLGRAVLARTHGEEFSGSFLGGIVADRGAVAFDVESAGNGVGGTFRIRRTAIWNATGGRAKLVRKLVGEARVADLDAGRIAVVRRRKVAVLLPGGGIRTFALAARVLGAALDGPRLLVLQRARVTAIDLRSGRPTASWHVRGGLGPPAELEDAQGDLVAYVVGAAVHVLRLSDGHELVADTPNATEPVFARLVPGGLFYSYNESYAGRPGRLAFVTRAVLERALASKAAAG